ncbi:unnamed protein product [Cylicocyclus nassatus]|uniref:Uncharacterized protein n=1 Tax=Cylicocyclus nassatus TaxID=53992 RepID=A0AA36GKR9_CYLNA|nr:unnamed protein product [Cylicocyclus nassatus]
MAEAPLVWHAASTPIFGRMNNTFVFTEDEMEFWSCQNMRVGVNDFDFYFDAHEYPDEKEFGYKELPGFLGNPLYKHPKAFLNIDYDKTVTVRKFSLMVLYKHLMG